MRMVILDGREQDSSLSAELRESLAEKLRQAVITVFPLSIMGINDCRGCFHCWTKTPGECIIADRGREVAEAVANCDVLVFISPVRYGGYNSLLKTAVDRLIPNVSPLFIRIYGETHHARRYADYPRLLGIGLNPDNEEERDNFARVVHRNALNYHAPKHKARFIDPVSDERESDELARAIRSQLSDWGMST